jgi:7,8-dihydropterin-6-yl-methyl-4-(beta-D-ribofuranosyl)aminobenzene 5'-phosphate synthase
VPRRGVNAGNGVRKAIRFALLLITAVTAVTVAGAVWLQLRTSLGAAEVDREWRATKSEVVRNLGSTRRLEITPLVNWHGEPGFATEAGVSYLVRTDDLTILFDVGWNEQGRSPSTLQRNMAKLGIAPSSIDAVFISHAHRDHVGGAEWERDRTFALGSPRIDLGGRQVWAPKPMRYPGARVAVTSRSQRLALALATTGTIARQLAMGRVEEQALVVNVEGHGLVVLVGCGHQTVPKLLERVRATFSHRLFGLVGDLHYPVPRGRLSAFNIDLQRRLASGAGPLSPIGMADVEREIALLKTQDLKLLALGGHDTSDEVLALAARRFGSSFEPVRVGRPIVIGSREGTAIDRR